MVVTAPVVNLPVEKMCITNQSSKPPEKIYVLYNPESYVQSKQFEYTKKNGVAQTTPSIQATHGSSETISMDLFFDTVSSITAGGTFADKAKLAAGSLLPSPAKEDVRNYTKKIYGLLSFDGKCHAPPLLKLEWASLQFEGFLVSCTQKFTKFSEMGFPVRATLSVKFVEYKSLTEGAKSNPFFSPDTSKFRTVHQGDSLWAMSEKEYGECSSWRLIAEANGIENPRLLETGVTLRLPAIKR